MVRCEVTVWRHRGELAPGKGKPVRVIQAALGFLMRITDLHDGTI